MISLSANIRLRPVRIALLVRPTDLASIRRFMRISTCLWGGMYNPIIPVFRNSPREWRPQLPERVKGYAIARGYVEFFEPDAFVESEKGLLEEAGLGPLRGTNSLDSRVIVLKDFLGQTDHRDWSEPHFGLSVVDVLRRIYEHERRFELRDKRPAVLIRPQRDSALVEAVFGAFPSEKAARYLGKGFEDVYRPVKLKPDVDAWREVFRSGAQTPLGVTQHGIEATRSWMHDLVVFVFDPGKEIDLIDLWNLRLESKPVLPVPLPWLPDLVGDIRTALIAEHRPLQGNPHGVMHHGTVEFARSITESRAMASVELLKPMPEGSLAIKIWRTRVWVDHVNDAVHRDGRLEITAEERRLALDADQGDRPSAKFESLAPDFASRYGGLSLRWVNAVKLTSFGATTAATVVPFNTFDWHWPRLDSVGEKVTVGTEGWVFAQRFKGSSESIQLHKPEDIIIGYFRRAGIESKLSEPGHIARQILNHLGGLWGVHLLANKETLQLLNAMAGGVRRRREGDLEIEEEFDRRSRSVKDWDAMIARRTEANALPRVELEDFTSRNVIRLGVETQCPKCQALNWHSLSDTNYQLPCIRCLNDYAFPQAAVRRNNGNWAYRVTGPFSVPDYARGSYGALLALRVLEDLGGGARGQMTFSTALDMSFDGVKAEADFVVLQAPESMDRCPKPDLVIGEAKSLGDGPLIKRKDLAKLKAIAARLPGAFIAISVMRPDFTPEERTMLIQFVKWARRPDETGAPTNPVVLMTGNELFHRFSVSMTWKDLGGRHAAFSDYQYFRNLARFAEATQAIYLGLPSHFEVRRTAWEKRQQRKHAASTKNPA